MNSYENLLEEARKEGLIVKELPYVNYDGLIVGNKIGIRKSIRSTRRKADILAEEIMHYRYTHGNILDQSIHMNRKQERLARFHAYNKRIGFDGLIRAFNAGCKNRYEIAECLEVSEEFLEEALKCYKEKYGPYKLYKGYLIIFEPQIGILKMF